MSRPRFAAVVVISGFNIDAATASLRGAPVWTHAWSALAAVTPRYLVAPPGRLSAVHRVAGAPAVLDGRDGLPAALRHLLTDDPHLAGVVLHDADRPAAPAPLAAAVTAELAIGAEVCVPMLPVVETLKEVDAEGYVVRTVPRDGLSHLQTPAGVARATLATVLPVAPATAGVADLLRLALGATSASSAVVVLPGDPRGVRFGGGAGQLELMEALLPSSRSASARSSG